MQPDLVTPWVQGVCQEARGALISGLCRRRRGLAEGARSRGGPRRRKLLPDCTVRPGQEVPPDSGPFSVKTQERRQRQARVRNARPYQQLRNSRVVLKTCLSVSEGKQRRAESRSVPRGSSETDSLPKGSFPED